MFMNGRIGYDDPARLRAYGNFKGNLEDILCTAHKAGVPVILSTVAVNLKDCAPLASLHRAGLSPAERSKWETAVLRGESEEAVGRLPSAVDQYRRAQISINLTNFNVVPPHAAFEEVKKEAATLSTTVTGSEIVGLVPKEALLIAGRFYLAAKAGSAGEEQLLKAAVDSLGLSQFEPFDLKKKIIEFMI